MTVNPHDAEDTAVYEKQGFGNRIGFGKKPALLIIDFINGFNDPDAFGGGNIQEAIDNTAELLAVAREPTQLYVVAWRATWLSNLSRLAKTEPRTLL